MLRSNSKSLGNHVVSPGEEKEKLQREGLAEKKGFKSGMKERVGDGKLIIISTLCLHYGPVSLSVFCHKSVFCRNGRTNRASFWHGSFLPPILYCVVIGKFGYLQKRVLLTGTLLQLPTLMTYNKSIVLSTKLVEF